MFILTRSFLSYLLFLLSLCVWDEVGLLSDISWAVMHNCCHHLQSKRHQKGSNVSPLPTLPRLNICAQVWRCALWGHLLQFVPFEKLWAQAETAGCPPNPSLPTGSWKVGREPDPNRLQVCNGPAPLFTTDIWKGVIADSLLAAKCCWPRLAESIIRAGSTQLPMCQSAIIGVSVPYI